MARFRLLYPKSVIYIWVHYEDILHMKRPHYGLQFQESDLSHSEKWVNISDSTEMANGWNYYLLTYLHTELSPSWEAANCAATQKIPSNFKEPEGSSLCSQEPSTGPYPEPDRSSPYHHTLSH
jgi:hypothetical protein